MCSNRNFTTDQRTMLLSYCRRVGIVVLRFDKRQRLR